MRAGIHSDSERIAAKVPQRSPAKGAAPRKSPERVEDYLEHIAEAIERATGYFQPISGLAAFTSNQQAHDAVVRNIEIIGEAVTKIYPR